MSFILMKCHEMIMLYLFCDVEVFCMITQPRALSFSHSSAVDRRSHASFKLSSSHTKPQTSKSRSYCGEKTGVWKHMRIKWSTTIKCVWYINSSSCVCVVCISVWMCLADVKVVCDLLMFLFVLTPVLCFQWSIFWRI